MSAHMMRWFEFLMIPRNMLVLGLSVGLLVAIIGGWDILEPTSGLATLAFAAATWWQTKKKAKARYANIEGEDFIIVLELKRTVVESMTKQFGRAPDQVLFVKKLIGTIELTTEEHWETLVRAVWEVMSSHQDKNILFASDVPGQLWACLGQMAGMDRLRVKWLGYFNGQIDESCPRPRGDWMLP